MNQNKKARLIFAGTPEFAAKHLAALLACNYDICAVFTQPDRPAGRGRKSIASPVKSLALEHELPVYQPLSLKDPEQHEVIAHCNADLMIVVAYGLILPQSILDAPQHGCINVHASLLPRWRGAAPIQRAIEAGDQESGVAIMKMAAGLDTGPVLATHYCGILPEDTSEMLHDRLAAMGSVALPLAIDGLIAGDLSANEQNHELATYAHKIEKSEARIDWSLDATALLNKIRAFNPWPVCTSDINGLSCRIWSAQLADVEESKGIDPEKASAVNAGTILDNQDCLLVKCGDHQAIKIKEMQLPGARKLDVKAILNSKRSHFAVGSRFG